MPSTATSTWTGALKEGAGKIKLGNGAFEGDYSFKSRFEDGKEGTNPEELIAAAHSACFAMATTSELGKAGIDSESVETSAAVTLKIVDGTPTITKIVLDQTINAPGASEDEVRKVAEAAKAGCPVTRALAGVDDIELNLTINV